MTDAADALARLALVADLPSDQRAAVLSAGHHRELPRGVVLFSEGQPADAVFAVVDGQVKLVRHSPDGRELLLHLVHPGQSFAEAALLGRATYPATAVAVADSRLWCLPRDRLLDLLRSSPELGLAMIASVSQWTRRLAAKLELLTQHRVEERLAVYLVARAPDGVLEAGTRVALEDPRHLIAAQIGTGPEVLSRTFRRLEEESILEVTPSAVVVVDPGRLRALAGWLGDHPDAHGTGAV